MASDVPPVRGSAYTDYISLISQADANLFQTSVTLASGDVTLSKDGGSFTNIASLPVEIGTSGWLAVVLTGTEMTADTIVVRFRDAAGSEWADAGMRIKTAAQTLDTIDTNVDSILADTGTDGVALADGVITAAKLATDAITAAKIAANAIGASELAADAITSSELATSAAQEIADEILKRGVSNTEDAADAHSLTTLILAALESTIAGATWTIRKTGGATFTTKTITTDSDADPITSVT